MKLFIEPPFATVRDGMLFNCKLGCGWCRGSYTHTHMHAMSPGTNMRAREKGLSSGRTACRMKPVLVFALFWEGSGGLEEATGRVTHSLRVRGSGWWSGNKKEPRAEPLAFGPQMLSPSCVPFHPQRTCHSENLPRGGGRQTAFRRVSSAFGGTFKSNRPHVPKANRHIGPGTRLPRLNPFLFPGRLGR